jgi:hypothetical protein
MLMVIYPRSIPSALITWLTLHADVVDLDVDAVTEAVAVVDLVVEDARTRRRNGFPSPNSVVS